MVTVGRDADHAHAGEIDGGCQRRQHVGQERLGSAMAPFPWQHGRHVLFEVVVHGGYEGVGVTGERRLVDSTHQIPIALLLLGCTHISYLPWDDLSSRLNPVARTLSSSLSR